MGLELFNITIHAAGRGGAERAGGHARGGFRRAGVIDRVIAEILGQFAGGIEDFLELGVGDIAGDDDGSC